MTTNAEQVQGDPLAELNLLVRVHQLRPLMSERKIAAELKISRRKVSALLAQDCPMQMQDPVELIVESIEPSISRTLGVHEITELAIRPEGVKRGAYQSILGGIFGFVKAADYNGLELNMTEQQHRDIKRDVRRGALKRGSTAVFVPAWMDATDAKRCNRAMLEAVQEAYEAIEHAAMRFCQEFPEASFKSAMHEITALAVPGYAAEPVANRLDRNEEIAEVLAERNPSTRASQTTPTLYIVSQMAQGSTTHVSAEGGSALARTGPADPELNRLCM